MCWKRKQIKCKDTKRKKTDICALFNWRTGMVLHKSTFSKAVLISVFKMNEQISIDQAWLCFIDFYNASSSLNLFTNIVQIFQDKTT